MKKKIIITGGQGKFASYFKKFSKNYNIQFPDKKKLNVLNKLTLSRYLNKYKPDYLIHNAALSRPISIHEIDIVQSINKNIIGTCNVVNECFKRDIKLIYFSSNYVYPCEKGNYKESSPLLPKNNYAWSKLGGECAVQMYKNSLILRVCMTEKPFIHKKAYANVKSNFIFQEDAAKIIIKLLNKKGIINVGGQSKTIYKFAKQKNSKVEKIYSKGEFPKRMDMSLSKLKKLI